MVRRGVGSRPARHLDPPLTCDFVRGLKWCQSPLVSSSCALPRLLRGLESPTRRRRATQSGHDSAASRRTAAPRRSASRGRLPRRRCGRSRLGGHGRWGRGARGCGRRSRRGCRAATKPATWALAGLPGRRGAGSIRTLAPAVAGRIGHADCGPVQMKLVKPPWRTGRLSSASLIFSSGKVWCSKTERSRTPEPAIWAMS